jgi:hypothetical protein
MPEVSITTTAAPTWGRYELFRSATKYGVQDDATRQQKGCGVRLCHLDRRNGMNGIPPTHQPLRAVIYKEDGYSPVVRQAKNVF